jgi:hypothetical protein
MKYCDDTLRIVITAAVLAFGCAVPQWRWPKASTACPTGR